MKAYLYVRFSTKRQKDGKSIERQTTFAREFCRAKGAQLDESLGIWDEGRSGYRGEHLERKGGLRRFQDNCERGRVAPGSFLIVENLDRLSRQEPAEGIGVLKELIKRFGIAVVVIAPRMELNRGNLGDMEGVLAYFELLRGHRESAVKSYRSAFNWQSKRDNIGRGILTHKVPSWVRVVDGTIVEVEEKAAVVRRVYDLARRGFGARSIAKRLNAEGVLPISRARLWHESYVYRLLRSRAVLGEMQPRKLEGGAYVPAGPVVCGYFPRVVSPDAWHAVRQAMASRKHDRGRVTKRVTNLFTHIVFQGGEAMAVRGSNGVRYLQTAWRADPGVRYDHFERVVLWWLKEVRLAPANAVDQDALSARAAALDASIGKLAAAVREFPEVVDDLLDMKRQRAELAVRIEAAAVPVQGHYLHGRRLIDALGRAGGEELEVLRRELRQTIRHLVERIDVSVARARKGQVTVELVLSLRDGHKRGCFYKTAGGRVVAAGLKVVPGMSLAKLWGEVLAELAAEGATGDCRDEVLKRVNFPLDPDPRQNVKALCRELRSEGKSYEQIRAATGLHRVTIYEYLRGLPGLVRKRSVENG